MRIELNGEPKEVPEGLTVTALLAHLAIDAPRVAVELNTQVVRRVALPTTPINPGDRVEIVTFVGGG